MKFLNDRMKKINTTSNAIVSPRNVTIEKNIITIVNMLAKKLQQLQKRSEKLLVCLPTTINYF